MAVKNFLKFYLPALIWMGLIFYFSSLSELRYRAGGISSEVFLRKGAHFLEYAVLAGLWWRIFFVLGRRDWKKAYGWSFLITFGYALSDEWHQSWVDGRSGRLIDAVYDGLSGLVFLQGRVFFLRKSFFRFLIWVGFLTSLILLESWMIKQARNYQNELKETSLVRQADLAEAEKTPPAETLGPTVFPTPSPPIEPENKAEETPLAKNPLPEKVFISVPFTSQAPFAQWDEYHEEACEEASLLMVAYYLKKEALTKEKAEQELQSMIDFQLKHYGDYKDTSVEQTIQLGRDYFGLENLKAVYDFSLEDLKGYLAQGRPIIVPAAGRRLGNPNFTAPGPLYHNLVLVGFEKNVIITNDPGTRRGEGYRYDEQVLFSAIHDFEGDKNKIEQGRKAMIVIQP